MKGEFWIEITLYICCIAAAIGIGIGVCLALP